jgi:hypothetical protein
METCTITIPAVVSLYCRQIQLGSTGRLLHTMFWHWNFDRIKFRQSIPTARPRLVVQTFVCVYVLLFATLVSVMTGYRAGLSGFVGYDTLFPIDRLMHPRLSFHDAARVGLSDTPMFATEQVFYPEHVRDPEAKNSTLGPQDIPEFLALSGDFEEPYGSLVDCR